MSRKCKVACIQFENSSTGNSKLERDENRSRAESRIREAAENGSNIILVHELFETNYFCQVENPSNFKFAREEEELNIAKDGFLKRMSQLAAELNIVLPISFFEKHCHNFFNSLIVFNADGCSLGVYRKSHIPTGPGYQEKYYFTPGNTGFKVFQTKFCRLGVGICWDQWFPETVREASLKGAEIMVFPTAIGNEPNNPSLMSKSHWKRTIQGHAASNMVPIAVANRTGRDGILTFYGNSFICDETGQIVTEFNTTESGCISHTFDLDEIAMKRYDWGLFRDRRPDLYKECCSKIDSSDALDKKKIRLPAEWETHRRCFILWPYDGRNWKNQCKDAEKAFSEVISAITSEGEEDVCIVCIPSQTNRLKTIFKNNSKVSFLDVNYDDCWARDIAPMFVKNKNGETTAVLFDFDGYGRKFPFSLDRKVKKKMAAKLKIRFSRCDVILEGGAIDCNGDGIAVLTKPTVICRNRPLYKFNIETRLNESLGISKFLWLEKGLNSDKDTDGHVDNICRFVNRNTLVLHWPENREDPDYEACRNAERKIQRFNLKNGSDLKIRKVVSPFPVDCYRKEDVQMLEGRGEFGRKIDLPLCMSYINFYIANKAVLIPKFGLETDKIAKETFKECFPERKVVQISARNIILGGGGLHCITKDEPL